MVVPVRVLGLMTGTSADGIDLCVVNFSPAADDPSDLEARVVAVGECTWPNDLREAIVSAVTSAPRIHFAQLIDLDAHIGSFIGAACSEFLAEHGESVDLIVSPGQTVYHHVEAGSTRGTLALGNAARIHAATGAPVLTHVRDADIALGGTGAPLAPILDALLASEPAVLVNIGGIANFSAVGPVSAPRAGDTGPGNALMDAVCQARTGDPFDADGRRAASGSVIPELLHAMLQDPYFSLPFPKSTGREYFSPAWLEQVALGTDITLTESCTNDVLATLAELSAVSIAEAVAPEDPKAPIHLTGGGARNRFLVERIRHHLAGRDVRTGPVHNVDPDSKEAFLMALIGYLSVHGLPSSIPSTTGAHSRAVLGSLTPPTAFAHASRAVLPRRLTVEVSS